MSLSFYLFLSASLFLFLSPVLFGRLSPLAASQGHPNPHGPEPGNICPRDICVLIESPISSLIERTIGRFSLSPFPLFSVPLWFARAQIVSFSQARSASRLYHAALSRDPRTFSRQIVSVANKNSLKHCSANDTNAYEWLIRSLIANTFAIVKR